MSNINPTTEELIPTPPMHSSDQVRRILAQSAAAFETWKVASFKERSVPLRKAAAILRRESSALAALMGTEMGKPVTAAKQEIEKCAWTCDWFADHGARMLEQETISTDASTSCVRYEPLGPILAIMPWNFPFWQVFRFAAPSLMAGNVAVLKHAPNVPGCALAIERIFAEAGYPAGVFSTILIENDAAKSVIENPVIRAVTLTGSTRAGRAVASQAGAVIKKVVLELGGSDAFIVLPDVDVHAVAKKAAVGRCINSGQSCIAAKRFIVHEALGDAFEAAMVKAMSELKTGDPSDPATDLGPLARKDLLDNLHAQIQQSIAQGARLLCGGDRLPRRGFFYAPTVLAGVEPGMAVFDEETFGPVAAITRCRDAADAVRLANLSRYGLGASLWTNDIDLARRLATRIEVGCVFINGNVKSDARLPFGGIKDSGIGRELGAAGIREFVNIKTVWVG